MAIQHSSGEGMKTPKYFSYR